MLISFTNVVLFVSVGRSTADFSGCYVCYYEQCLSKLRDVNGERSTIRRPMKVPKDPKEENGVTSADANNKKEEHDVQVAGNYIINAVAVVSSVLAILIILTVVFVCRRKRMRTSYAADLGTNLQEIHNTHTYDEL